MLLFAVQVYVVCHVSIAESIEDRYVFLLTKLFDHELFRCLWSLVNILWRLRFHDDNENDNANEISLSFSLRFCTQRDE